MNLYHYTSKTTDDNVAYNAYRQTIFNVLASESTVKMLLLKQECPEE
jgi:hypothetical protein